MSRNQAVGQFNEALRAGRNYYKSCVLQGRYPYLQVLDEILDSSMIAGRVNLGVIEIPTDRIIGTKSVGRKNAFAANFMPLLAEKTEFASKWIDLCTEHLDGEGIRNPIFCYEYLGRFYVQEGNKRVSVLKSYDAPTIPGYVTRLVPVWSEAPEVRRYYEFLESYQLTGLYQVSFTRPGSFPKLQAALGFEAGHRWSEEERRNFLSGFTYFQDSFRKLGGDRLTATVSDALLVWLEVYSFDTLKDSSAAELVKSLGAVWSDVKILGRDDPIALNTEPAEEEPDKGLLSRLVSAVFPTHLTVAFVNAFPPEESTWVQGHIQGIRYLEDSLGDRVTVLTYNGTGGDESAENAMEQAVAEGAQVIFATTAQLIRVCCKVAARHPGVKILNCSVSMPYTGVRTYYSRIYEGKFISGAIAGAMSRGDLLGYVASSPIFGVPAGINAFALGARLTNPRARVKLLWSCLPGDPVEELARQGIDLISTLDIPTPDQFPKKRGMYQLQPDGTPRLLSSPYWNWGVFYVKMVTSIMNGGWDALSSGKDGQPAVNYWWGMASGVIGLWLSPQLPEGVRNLAEILQKGITDGSVTPFHRFVRSQDGALRNDGERWFTPAELLHMDWLCDTVEGSIPSFDQLLPKAQSIVRLQGVYRDQIPPERAGVSP